jgi:F0F1-type ATP synthase assembly protein I
MIGTTPVGNVGGHPNRQQRTRPPFFRRAGLFLGIAFELPATILGGLLIGYILDDYFNASPWFLIVITAFAFAGAFMRLVQWAKYFAKTRNEIRIKKDDTAH